MEIIKILLFIVIGWAFGIIIGLAIRPRNNARFELDRLQKLGAQQRVEIEKLRDENRNLFAESAARDAQIKSLTAVRETMLNDFRAISADLIERQKESVIGTQKTVLLPMADEMKKLKSEFDVHIKDLLKNSSENKSAIDVQIKNMIEKSDALRAEAGNLANALRNKKTQGCWGETYLETVLQSLGMFLGTDYNKEVFFKTQDDDANIRPDFIVNLPGNRKIIIDSKVSMESYLNYENAENDEDKEKFANEFMAATEAHIKKLSDKDYQKHVRDSGLDYVFMFMPIESAYILAMRRKPTLYADSQKKNVALITSSLLYPILKTVEMLLNMDKQNKNITNVIEMVNSLYDKYAAFTQNFVKIGREIDSAKTVYDNAMGQLSLGKGNMNSVFEKIKKQSGIASQKQTAIGVNEDED